MLFIKVVLFYIICILILFLNFYTTEYQSSDLNPKFFIWGPGIKPAIILPVQYFYIKYSLLNQQNETFTFDISKLDVEISTDNGKIYAEIINRQDCTFIIKYQIYRSFLDITILIRYNGINIAESPYKVKGIKNPEDCYCPLLSLNHFKDVYACKSTQPNQIFNDFSVFTTIDMDILRSKIIDRFSQSGMHSLTHYVIKNNQIYRRTFGEHVDYKIFSDEILLSVTRKVELPDLELFINLGDWPLSKKNQIALPVISWCGSNDTYDLILPTYEIMHSTLKATTRYGMDTLSVQENRKIPWQNKSKLAFFRGRDSSEERLDLVRLSIKMPHLFDARLTNMFFFKHSPDLGLIKQFVPFNEFFQHSYQISMDGTVAAYRLAYLLAANSLVLKQQSQYYEHFYDLLKPFVHYVPFNKDLSDLLGKLQWSKDNEIKVLEIIKNANKLIDEYLNPVELFCYHVHFFEEYSKRLVSKVKIFDDMELVKQPDIPFRCECESQIEKHQEL